MCYSGRCKYEDSLGECSIVKEPILPDDAFCVEVEKKIEAYEERQVILFEEVEDLIESKVIKFEELKIGDIFSLLEGDNYVKSTRGDILFVATSEPYIVEGVWQIDFRDGTNDFVEMLKT